MAKRSNQEENANQNEEQQPVKQSSSLPGYLEAALRLSASRPTGAPTVDTELLGPKPANAKCIDSVPGIMTLNYVPTLGYSNGPNSAVNRAAFTEFNKIRSKISGNRPYEPADHMIYRMAVDSLRDLYLYMCRVYRVLSAYSATNLYTPRAIISSMGLDFDDWRINAAALYQWLQNHESALKPFPTVPIGTITERHNIYNTYIFHDGEIEASQYYILNQRAFWSYEQVDEVKGLTPVWPGEKFNDFTQLWDDMYTALQNSSDVYIIAADIRRAFEEACVTDLTAPGVGDMVEYIKLDSVLTSIMNATITPKGQIVDVPAFYKAFRIEDMDGYIFCAPVVNTCTRLDPNEFPEEMVIGTANLSHLNMVMASPTPADYLAATRFRPAQYITLNGTTSMLTAFGTEVITSGVIVCAPNVGLLDDASNYEVIRFGTFVAANKDNDDTEVERESLAHVLHLISCISKFDWHPPLVTPIDYELVSYDVTPAGLSIGGDGSHTVAIIEDIQNYVPITNTDLTNIHEANILYEFGF